MSKKMKGVALFSSPHVSCDDIRARFKHQTLLKDYLELQQETEAARNKLEVMKQKKHTLEAEVRFLRRRHKFLSKTRPTSQQVKSHNVETTQYRKSKKEKVNPKKVAALPNLPLFPDQIQRGKTYTKKKNIVTSQPLPVFDFDKNVNSHGNNSFPVTEIKQKSAAVQVQARVPIFDLNQLSIEEEEEELQESFEDQRKEQQNDLKLSICRNVGDSSTNLSGKRKISWRDLVALRV
ncbi:hypothetical protein HanRHA438_Chr10g0473251 [Helianthus annuus]|nr:hypothetical protein HanRHA438_Chr10g0473251 [Helianthus annuus]